MSVEASWFVVAVTDRDREPNKSPLFDRFCALGKPLIKALAAFIVVSFKETLSS